jgi:hypothetical protein
MKRSNSGFRMGAIALGASLVLFASAAFGEDSTANAESKADAKQLSSSPVEPAPGRGSEEMLTTYAAEIEKPVPVSPYAKFAKRRSMEPKPEHNPSLSIMVGGGRGGQH